MFDARAVRRLAVRLAPWILLGALATPAFQRKVYSRDDLGLYSLPMRAHLARCLASGDDPRWFPGVYCGIDIHGEGQIGLAHPVRLLLYAALPLDVGFNAELLLSYPLIAWGMARLLKRWGLPSDSAWFGAFAFAWTGCVLNRAIHLHAVQILAHLPWLVLAAWAALEGRRPGRALAAVALLTGSQWLLGYPQYVLYSSFIELACVLVWAIRTGRIGRPWIWALAKGVGFLIGAVQWLPTWESLTLSVRALPTREFLGRGSLHPAELFQLVAPYAYADRVIRLDPSDGWGSHELGLYPGAAVVVLAAWGALSRPPTHRLRRLRIGALVFVAVGLVLAFGRHTPIFDIFTHLPILNVIRGPARWLVVTHCGLAALAALGFTDLIERQRCRNYEKVVWVVVGGLPILAWTCAAWLDDGPRRAGLGDVLLGPTLLSLAVAVLVAARLGFRWAPIVLVVLAVGEQATYGLKPLNRPAPARIGSILERVSTPPMNPPGLRAATEDKPNLLTMKERLVFRGYVALTPARILDPDAPLTRRLSSVAWERDGDSWKAVPDPFPRIRAVTRWTFPEQGFRAAVESVDHDREAVVDRSLPARAESPGSPGSIRLLDDRPGSITAAAEGSGTRLLVLSESWHPGWKVDVDGRTTVVIRTNGDFLGCLVPDGAHRVRFRFDPRSHRIGAAVSLLGLLVVLSVYLADRPRFAERTVSDGERTQRNPM